MKIINEIKTDKIIIFISHKIELLNQHFDDIYELREVLFLKKINYFCAIAIDIDILFLQTNPQTYEINLKNFIPNNL